VFVSDFNAGVGLAIRFQYHRVIVHGAPAHTTTARSDSSSNFRPIGECAVPRQHDGVAGARIRCRAQPFAIEVVNIQVEVLDGVMVSQFVQSGGDCGVRRPPDNLVEDPQVCAGRRDCTGH
jgi:hypothetical protein